MEIGTEDGPHHKVRICQIDRCTFHSPNRWTRRRVCPFHCLSPFSTITAHCEYYCFLSHGKKINMIVQFNVSAAVRTTTQYTSIFCTFPCTAHSSVVYYIVWTIYVMIWMFFASPSETHTAHHSIHNVRWGFLQRVRIGMPVKIEKTEERTDIKWYYLCSFPSHEERPMHVWVCWREQARANGGQSAERFMHNFASEFCLNFHAAQSTPLDYNVCTMLCMVPRRDMVVCEVERARSRARTPIFTGTLLLYGSMHIDRGN